MAHPTPCELCDEVHPASRTWQPHRWLCMRFPRLDGLDPVAPTQGVVMQPYMRCSGINGGFCCLFKPRREAPPKMEATDALA
jgi:hypothetical protein